MLIVVLSLAVCGMLVAAVLLLIRRRVLTSRLYRIENGEANDRVIAMWDYLSLLEQAGSITPDDESYRVMQKARFSPHTVTKEELAHVANELTRSLETIKNNAGSFVELYYRYIRFLY